MKFTIALHFLRLSSLTASTCLLQFYHRFLLVFRILLMEYVQLKNKIEEYLNYSKKFSKKNIKSNIIRIFNLIQDLSLYFSYQSYFIPFKSLIFSSDPLFLSHTLSLSLSRSVAPIRWFLETLFLSPFAKFTCYPKRKSKK